RESGTESSTGPAQSPEWRPGWILKLRCTDFRTPQANTTLVHRDAPLPSLRGAYPTGEIVNRRSGTWWRQSNGKSAEPVLARFGRTARLSHRTGAEHAPMCSGVL